MSLSTQKQIPATLVSAVDSAFLEQWDKISHKLEKELGETTYRSWLSPLVVVEASEEKVLLGAPTRFMREWVQSHYLDLITDYWKASCPNLRQCGVVVHREMSGVSAKSTKSASKPQMLTVAKTDLEQPELVQSSLDKRFTFDSYIVGKSNELAYKAAKRVASGDSVITGCNPMFIYGGVGLGKTHLMHAIGWHMRQHKPERRVMYLSAEKFAYQFVQALRNKDSFAFKEMLRSVDVLMIDDIQFLAGKKSTQEEFFHTFNALIDQNKQLIVTADRSPSDIEGLEERIRSRLGWGLVIDIHDTNYELRLGILRSKLKQMKDVTVSDKILEFLAHRIVSNVRELEGALNRVVAHSTLVGCAITLELVQEVLSDLLRSNDRKVTIEDIQRKVTQHYNIKMADMHSPRRARSVARPRQIAMYLCKKLTTRSLPEIGRKFGGRDHTTVMHAVKKVTELAQEDDAIMQDIEALTQSLRS